MIKKELVLGRYYYDAENGPALQRFKPQVKILIRTNFQTSNYFFFILHYRLLMYPLLNILNFK